MINFLTQCGIIEEKEIYMKTFKFLSLLIVVYFLISNVTIFDDEVRSLGEPLSLLAVYSVMGLFCYKCMRWLGFGPLFTPKRMK